MGYKVEVENLGSKFSYADDQKKRVFDLPRQQVEFTAYVGNRVNVNAQYTFKSSGKNPHLTPYERLQTVYDIAKLEIQLGLTDIKRFHDLLKVDIGERMKYEHCDSAEELKFVIDGLRARGALQGSVGIRNLVNAVIDEANLADKLVLNDQVRPELKTLTSTKPPIRPTPLSKL